MEPATLITTALALVKPYFKKTGERIAEKVGEEIWNVIKNSFSKEDILNKQFDFKNETHRENLAVLLSKRIETDSGYKERLETAIRNAENKMNVHKVQNIKNEGKIEKQVNIQNNNGAINL